MKLYTADFKAMGSPCSLHLYCQTETDFERAKHSAFDLLYRLETKYSRYIDTSLVAQINANAGTKNYIALDDETWLLLQYANTAYNISDGLFDITSGILRTIWHKGTSALPSERDLQRCMTKVGWEHIDLNQQRFVLPIKGMQIDFGGIVKEYAADAAVSLLLRNGVSSGLIDLGGDIAIVGAKPDNTAWYIAISDPKLPSEAIAKIPMLSGGLASSGDYQRFITIGHQRYCHIINPKTGYPVTGLVSASVWADQCVVAGTLATSAMLKGMQGSDWLKQISCRHLCVDSDGNIYQH